MDAPTPQWLSTSDAAWLLGVTPKTIRNLIDAGHMKASRIGRVISIRHCDIDEWLHRTLGELDALEPVGRGLGCRRTMRSPANHHQRASAGARGGTTHVR